MTTEFFQIIGNKLSYLNLTLENEIGGPMFRDLSGDGVPEVIFDNFSHYDNFEDASPSKFNVYRLNGSKLDRWRVLDNPRHLRLKWRLPTFG